MSTFQAAKLEVITLFDLSKDALHVYVGMLIFIAVVMLFRRPMRSLWPIGLVLIVACVGELFDARDNIADFGHWRAAASFHDIVNTTFYFWPAVLFTLARWTRLPR